MKLTMKYHRCKDVHFTHTHVRFVSSCPTHVAQSGHTESSSPNHCVVSLDQQESWNPVNLETSLRNRASGVETWYSDAYCLVRGGGLFVVALMTAHILMHM